MKGLSSGLKVITKATPERGMWIRTDHKYNIKFCTEHFGGSVYAQMPTLRLYETTTVPSGPVDMENTHINVLQLYILLIWILNANLTTYVYIVKDIQTSYIFPRTDTKMFQSTDKFPCPKVFYFYTA